jgi:pantothenate kinase
MTPSRIPLSADGHELAALVPPPGRRFLLGISGAPGAGKSTLAAALAASYNGVMVPLDGFHLADVELVRRGLRDRKGAPETFDADGYAALLTRIRSRPVHTVMAPLFERGLEQPLAGGIAVPPEVDLVVTEGNYLLLDDPPWPDARAQLDTVWHVVTADELRLPRLIARHERFGKSPDAAREWVERVDGANAVRIEAAAHRADLVLDLTAWEPAA